MNSPHGTPVKRVGGAAAEGRSSTVPRTTQLRRMYTKLITRYLLAAYQLYFNGNQHELWADASKVAEPCLCYGSGDGAGSGSSLKIAVLT